MLRQNTERSCDTPENVGYRKKRHTSPTVHRMEQNRQVLLSAAQAAEKLGIHVRKLQRLAASGQIEATKLPGQTGAYVFDEATIEAAAS
jgi:excisionase family DNA binding protein